MDTGASAPVVSTQAADLTAREILIAARSRIKNPENWCQGVLARDADGQSVPATSSAARRFCINGAIINVTGFKNWMPVVSAIEHVTGDSNTHFNDTHTHDQVLAALDRAIAKATGAA